MADDLAKMIDFGSEDLQIQPTPQPIHKSTQSSSATKRDAKGKPERKKEFDTSEGLNKFPLNVSQDIIIDEVVTSLRSSSDEEDLDEFLPFMDGVGRIKLENNCARLTSDAKQRLIRARPSSRNSPQMGDRPFRVFAERLADSRSPVSPVSRCKGLKRRSRSTGETRSPLSSVNRCLRGKESSLDSLVHHGKASDEKRGKLFDTALLDLKRAYGNSYQKFNDVVYQGLCGERLVSKNSSNVYSMGDFDWLDKENVSPYVESDWSVKKDGHVKLNQFGLPLDSSNGFAAVNQYNDDDCCDPNYEGSLGFMVEGAGLGDEDKLGYFLKQVRGELDGEVRALERWVSPKLVGGGEGWDEEGREQVEGGGAVIDYEDLNRRFEVSKSLRLYFETNC